MATGADGAEPMVTAKKLAPEVPQLLPAVTEILPPDEEGVTVMLFVVELPLQPPGSDHV